MINIIIVDDHELFRLGVKYAIADDYPNICVVGEAESSEELFSLLETTAADVVLLDLLLPGCSGIETARRLRKEYPEIKILVISTANTMDAVNSLIDIGIDGFISKRAGKVAEVAEAIHSIMSGMEYFGKDISTLIYKIYVSKKNTMEVGPEFTDREREVILHCRRGLLAKEIAERMNVSPRTVHMYKHKIFRKLGISNQMEMVQYALQHKIIDIN